MEPRCASAAQGVPRKVETTEARERRDRSNTEHIA